MLLVDVCLNMDQESGVPKFDEDRSAMTVGAAVMALAESKIDAVLWGFKPLHGFFYERIFEDHTTSYVMRDLDVC